MVPARNSSLVVGTIKDDKVDSIVSSPENSPNRNAFQKRRRRVFFRGLERQIPDTVPEIETKPTATDSDTDEEDAKDSEILRKIDDVLMRVDAIDVRDKQSTDRIALIDMLVTELHKRTTYMEMKDKQIIQI